MEPTSERDLSWETTDRGEASFRRKRLSEAAGGEQIGCSLYELPPGGRSWPYHFHAGNEEALYVLAGRGTLRTPDGTQPLATGDYVACRAAPEGAHRVHNDGDDPLRYLMVSTMDDPDVTVYPDGDAVGVFAGAPPGSTEERTVGGYFRRADARDYWSVTGGGDTDGSGDTDRADDADGEGAP